MAESAGIKLGIVRGISYGLFGQPDAFVPQVRALGASLVRIYFYWGQIEREPGRFDWQAVDAFLAQLDGSEEVWVTVCSSSSWATTTATNFLPPSPAKDNQAYARFVGALVGHCAGRVRYWQCNNEPSNLGLLWAGTASEYVAQLAAFRQAVSAADTAAQVVLGGCGYDVLSSPEGSPARTFFDHVVEHRREAFDLFSVHLYDDPDRIPSHIDDVRSLMRRHGYERPVVVGEYNGPTLFEFPEVVAKRHRLNCREIVTRNLLALSTGVTRTVCWNLAPEIPDYKDPYNLMGFLSGKFALMDYESKQLRIRHPPAETFRLLAQILADATEVVRLDAADGVVAIEVQHAGGVRSNVLWKRGDPFAGEDEPAIAVAWPWAETGVDLVDAFGARHAFERHDGALRFDLSVTPLFIVPAELALGGRSAVNNDAAAQGG